ncbi:VOC family protein [Microbacterium sp. NPDC089695]|uniref:VOC family protein n=1 Tax=Microbacterium sp. NPDC089695 TaxID=3364198 RepID=UPI0037F626E1
MTPAPKHHSLDYVELVVTDLDAARRFYGEAFGWTFVDYGPAYTGIASPDGDGTEVGGFLLSDQGRPPGGPLVLLYSDDLDATHQAITAAGGAVVQGPYEFPGGRRLHFTDPSGNELGVWSSR